MYTYNSLGSKKDRRIPSTYANKKAPLIFFLEPRNNAGEELLALAQLFWNLPWCDQTENQRPKEPKLPRSLKGRTSTSALIGTQLQDKVIGLPNRFLQPCPCAAKVNTQKDIRNESGCWHLRFVSVMWWTHPRSWAGVSPRAVKAVKSIMTPAGSFWKKTTKSHRTI